MNFFKFGRLDAMLQSAAFRTPENTSRPSERLISSTPLTTSSSYTKKVANARRRIVPAMKNRVNRLTSSDEDSSDDDDDDGDDDDDDNDDDDNDDDDDDESEDSDSEGE